MRLYFVILPINYLLAPVSAQNLSFCYFCCLFFLSLPKQSTYSFTTYYGLVTMSTFVWKWNQMKRPSGFFFFVRDVCQVLSCAIFWNTYWINSGLDWDYLVFYCLRPFLENWDKCLKQYNGCKTPVSHFIDWFSCFRNNVKMCMGRNWGEKM